MASFLYKSFRKKALVLIIALLFTVYNNHAQEGIGQQKPVKITGLLAANLFYVDGLNHPSNSKKFTRRWIVIPSRPTSSTQRGIVF